MATMTVLARPGLTKKRVVTLFRERFRGTYEVYETDLLTRDFIVKKNGWTGVGIKLKHASQSTELVFTGLVPSYSLSVFTNMLAGGLITMPFLRRSRKDLEDEMKIYIETEPEFH